MPAADEGSSDAADAGGSPDCPEVLGLPSVLEGQGVPASHCVPSGMVTLTARVALAVLMGIQAKVA